MRERLIEFDPAFDKRHPDPSKDYGIHGVNIRFVLKGPEGAVQFLLYTNWQLPPVTEELIAKPIKDKFLLKALFLPIPADLGYHSPAPHYEGQTSTGPCPYLDKKECYFDGSTLNAEPVYERLLKEGHEGVWAELEKCYDDFFKVCA